MPSGSTYTSSILDSPPQFMNKIIFLDIDGVLVTNKPQKTSNGLCYEFDTNSVCALLGIIKRTNSKIVISSSHRVFSEMCIGEGYIHNLYNRLKENFLLDHLHTDWNTNDFSEMYKKTREDEILDWLVRNKPIDNFIILDDVDIFVSLKSRLVLTTMEKGISDKNIIDAINLLTS